MHFVHAQVDCFAKIELSKHSGYIQQPFRVTITVYTQTWYTAPLDFDNIQIPNSFILPFDKTVPGMFDINGKKYAGIQFYFIVFPYKAGNFTVPAINIKAHTPPVGGYKSEVVALKTTPQKFEVKDVPSKLKANDEWFVAKDVNIYDHWNKPLKSLKVGDVVERTIEINAKGTLPQFIPDLKNIKPDWASIYPQDAALKDTRDENDANGKRVQTITYLLEQAGDFTVPPVEIRWWNPYNSRIYDKKTNTVSIHVNANPSLGILATLKDSLAAKQKPLTQKEVKKGPLTIYGILWYWFLLYAVIALVILYYIIKAITKLYKIIKVKRARYLQSEKHQLNKFLQASSTDKNKVLARLYTWWDSFAREEKGASIIFSAKKDRENEVIKNLQSLNKELYSNGEAADIKGFKLTIKGYRKRKLNNEDEIKQDKIGIEQEEW